MIKNWIVTGDTHGRVHGRIVEIANKYPDYKPEETGIIILGDVGLNYYLSRTEKKNKKIINESGYTLFCVRGNHEQRPEDVPGMISIYNSEVKNSLWIEEDFPNIKYLKDGHEYNFGGYYTKPNGEGIQIIDSNGYIVKNSSASQYTGTITLYAKWT